MRASAKESTMKLGQISIVHFGSKILASVLGFISTIYIARVLGAGALGTYSIALAVVSWLGLLGTMGITSAISKRVSEKEESGAYASAGVFIVLILFVFISILVAIFQQNMNNYVGFPAALFIIAMVGVLLAYNLVVSLLSGQHLVHVNGLLSPVKTGSRAILQIGAVISGLGVTGLFGGYIFGYMFVTFLGIGVVLKSFREFVIPEWRHFRRIIDYAKFSWLGSLRSNAFNWVDIAVLGLFVSNSFIGYYTAAWNIAQFLIIFGSSISQTLFPEMSKVSTEKDPNAISELVESAVSYAGLILVPGFVGGTILGEHILQIYGPDFAQAGVVLSVLIVATLIQSYQKQFTNTLNAIDQPDLAFKVNLLFIISNLILNAVLIYLYGWIGAATATAGSVAVSLCLSYYYVSSMIDFAIPTGKLLQQWIAAGIMGACIQSILVIEANYFKVNNNIIILLFLISGGAVIYFATLLGISPQFRTTVKENLPLR